jgi:hypothetical protein
MFDGLVTRWEMGGLLNDKRELKSAKDANWRGYVVKIGTLHGVFEALGSLELWQKLQVGQAYKFGGHLEDQRGTLRLMLDRALPLAEKPAA